MVFLLIWHGVLSGGILVVFITSESSYAMHEFSGVIVLGAVVVRLLVGLCFPAGTPLSLGVPLPQPTSSKQANRGSLQGIDGLELIKNMLNSIMPLALISTIGAAALSGLMMGGEFEGEFHQGLAGMSLTIIFVHVVLSVTLRALRTAKKRVM